MAKASLVRIDDTKMAVHNLELPSPPPARIYISGHTYRVAAPRIIHVPLANTVKFLLNWTLVAGKTAKNIGFLKIGGSGVTSDPSYLQALANALMTVFKTSAPWGGNFATGITLSSITVKDNGGTTAQATNNNGSMNGSNAASSLPPQCAVVLSWNVAESYRGGKPRWYLPGIPTNAQNSIGDSQITSAYATNLESVATTVMTLINGITVSSSTTSLGTISYQRNHVARPTPVFMTYLGVSVHERLDSQRRRSGKESLFPVIP